MEQERYEKTLIDLDGCSWCTTKTQTVSGLFLTSKRRSFSRGLTLICMQRKSMPKVEP